jgi:hypothetical protein
VVGTDKGGIVIEHVLQARVYSGILADLGHKIVVIVSMLVVLLFPKLEMHYTRRSKHEQIGLVNQV